MKLDQGPSNTLMKKYAHGMIPKWLEKLVSVFLPCANWFRFKMASKLHQQYPVTGCSTKQRVRYRKQIHDILRGFLYNSHIHVKKTC